MIKKSLLIASGLYIHGYHSTIEIFDKNMVKTSVNRGMSPYNDLIDWVGGYPFEVAKIDYIINFYLKRNFKLVKLHARSKKDLGCNEYLFEYSLEV